LGEESADIPPEVLHARALLETVLSSPTALVDIASVETEMNAAGSPSSYQTALPVWTIVRISRACLHPTALTSFREPCPAAGSPGIHQDYTARAEIAPFVHSRRSPHPITILSKLTRMSCDLSRSMVRRLPSLVLISRALRPICCGGLRVEERGEAYARTFWNAMID
jgi:hypothetical protein